MKLNPGQLRAQSITANVNSAEEAEIYKALTDSILKEEEAEIAKGGKGLPIGSMRSHGGRSVIKKANGWRPHHSKGNKTEEIDVEKGVAPIYSGAWSPQWGTIPVGMEKASKPQQDKVATVMREFSDGKLKSSSGEKVTKRDQAIAIALSEAGMDKGDDVEKADAIYSNDELKGEDTEKSQLADATLALAKAEFSVQERRELAREGKALPDGSYPIRNKEDLKNAIKTVGLGKSEAKAMAWIKKRAKMLGAEDMLPEKWDTKKAEGKEYVDIVICNRDGQILLLKRSKEDDYEPQTWSLPGGKVESSESSIAAIERETEEETGLTCCGDPHYLTSITHSDGNETHYFYSKIDEDAACSITLDNEEHQAYRWCYPEECEMMPLIADLGQYINKLYELGILKESYNLLRLS